MTRVTDFSIGTAADPAEEARKINLRFIAFVEAVVWHLASRRIDAPFGKLAVDITDNKKGPPRLTSRQPLIAIGIAVVYASVDHRALLAADPPAVRDVAARLTTLGLDAIARETGWRDPELEASVEALGRHEGPFRAESKRLRSRTRSGIVCTPIFEIDETSSRVRLECVDGDAVISSTEIISVPEPRSFWLFFDARKVRRADGTLQFLDRWGNELAAVDLPAR